MISKKEIQRRIDLCKKALDQFNERRDNINYNYYNGKKQAYEEVLKLLEPQCCGQKAEVRTYTNNTKAWHCKKCGKLEQIID